MSINLSKECIFCFKKRRISPSSTSISQKNFSTSSVTNFDGKESFMKKESLDKLFNLLKWTFCFNVVQTSIHFLCLLSIPFFVFMSQVSCSLCARLSSLSVVHGENISELEIRSFDQVLRQNELIPWEREVIRPQRPLFSLYPEVFNPFLTFITFLLSCVYFQLEFISNFAESYFFQLLHCYSFIFHYISRRFLLLTFDNIRSHLVFV